MATAAKKLGNGIPEGTGWEETKDRFPEDTILRKHGFKIHARPRGREAVWGIRLRGTDDEWETVLMGELEAMQWCIERDATKGKRRG